MSSWKNVSMRRILSGWMELVSRRTGSGGPLNVYAYRMGCRDRDFSKFELN